MNLFDFALFVASTYAVKFKDCGSDGIAVKDVSITPCPKEPCELIHGQNYSIKINFEEQISDNLEFEVCGMIGPVCVPFPTGAPDKAVSPGLNSYTFGMKILDVYPNIKLIGKFQLKGKNRMCILLPLKIMPAQAGLQSEGIFDHVTDAVRKVKGAAKQIFNQRPVINENDLNQL